MKIKTGDKVLIISGKNRGKSGKVINSFPRSSKIIVEGVNLQKKHVRPKKREEKGQIIEIAVPINVSNAQLICEHCSKIVRVGYKIEGDKKYRICKKCNKALK